MKALILIFFRLIVAAWKVLSAPLGGHCRFYPSCSCYLIEAIDEWGVVRGISLFLSRVSKCHPLNDGGVDMVPKLKTEK